MASRTRGKDQGQQSGCGARGSHLLSGSSTKRYFPEGYGGENEPRRGLYTLGQA
jgi:hypothetical protein